MGNYSNKVTKPLDTSSLDAALEDMKRRKHEAILATMRPAPVSKVVFDEILGQRERGSDERS